MSNSKCLGCGVFVAVNLTHCPICGKFMNPDKGQPCPTAYEAIDHKKLRKPWLISNFKRILLIAIPLFLGINLFNLGGNFDISGWWSLYPISSILLIYFAVLIPLGKNQCYWGEVFLQIVVTLGFLLFIDWYTDMIISWSLTFIFPITLSIFSIVAGLFVALRRNVDPGASLLVLLTIFLSSVGFFLLGMLLFPLLLAETYKSLPSLIAISIAFVIFVFFATFKFRDFVKAIFKKFHI